MVRSAENCYGRAMMKSLFATCLLTTAFVAAPTYAQVTDQTDQSEEDWRKSRKKRGNSDIYGTNTGDRGYGLGTPGDVKPISPVEQLPSESRRHLMKERAKAMAESADGDITDAEYKPSEAAKNDEQLMAEEKEAWKIITTDIEGSGGQATTPSQGGPNKVAIAGRNGTAPAPGSRGGSSATLQEIMDAIRNGNRTGDGTRTSERGSRRTGSPLGSPSGTARTGSPLGVPGGTSPDGTSRTGSPLGVPLGVPGGVPGGTSTGSSPLGIPGGTSPNGSPDGSPDGVSIAIPVGFPGAGGAGQSGDGSEGDGTSGSASQGPASSGSAQSGDGSEGDGSAGDSTSGRPAFPSSGNPYGREDGTSPSGVTVQASGTVSSGNGDTETEGDDSDFSPLERIRRAREQGGSSRTASDYVIEYR